MMTRSQAFNDFHFKMEPMVETTHTSTNERTDRQAVVYPSNGMLFSHKKGMEY